MTFPAGSVALSPELRGDQLRLGLWMFLATVTMLFAAFASAYIVRRSGSDWRHVQLPAILWVNTGVLGLSSVFVEAGVRAARRARWRSASAGFVGALLFGIAFLAGQALAWRQMVAAGVYLPTNPHSSFFYMLTGAHAVHIVAALVVLAWGLVSAAGGRLDDVRADLCRTFWHYLGGVWLFLFALVTLL